MQHNDLFVGKKVWLRPNPLYRDRYPNDLVETTISKVGLTCFWIDDPIRPPYVKYHIKTLKEAYSDNYKGEILLSIDGIEEFDKKEQLIIKIRKYFNSRAVYNEENEKLKQIIDILQL